MNKKLALSAARSYKFKFRIIILIILFGLAGNFSLPSGFNKAAQSAELINSADNCSDCGAGAGGRPPVRKKADEILIKFFSSDEIMLIKIAQSQDLAEVLESYNGNPAVEYAEPNYIYQAAIVPSDTYYNNQWYLQKIKAIEAWDDIRESPDVIIAIVDSGVQINHPDLKDNIWRNSGETADNKIDDDGNGYVDDINGWDFIDQVADPSPKFDPGFTEAGILHGTIVAGIAAASGNNAAGVAGISWRTQLLPLRVLDDKGEGNTNTVIKAIDYAINKKVNIINFSFVGFGFSRALESAIKKAYEAGIVIVAAAGNEQEQGSGYSLDEVPMYPVCHDGADGENRVIGVAATDTLDQKAPFSSYGFKCLDIASPGLSIFTTSVYAPERQLDGKNFNKYYDGYWSGTSMAAPMVSAAVSLIEQLNPGLDNKEAVNLLLHNSDNINRLNQNYLNQLGSGRLNIKAAISQIKTDLERQVVKLIIAPQADYPSELKISSQDGQTSDSFFAYDASFRGGVNVASGDVDGDGVSEIITGAGPGGGPHVRIFSQNGELKGQFFAYGASFRGGVNVASGDVDGDGVSEIITGAGPGGGPQVRIFNARGQALSQFFSYHPAFRGGVRVAVADVDGQLRDNKAEIITAAGPGGGPHLRIFSQNGELKGQFFAYGASFRGGVAVAAGDVDQDGLAEIITGAGPGGAPHVRVFEKEGRLLGSFYAYDNEFRGGVNVGAVGSMK